MQKIHKLDFCIITIHSEHLAEVVIDNGIEMNTTMVESYHDFLINHLKAPFDLLIDKQNSYSYTFEAQQKLATIEEIRKMAVVWHTKPALSSTKALLNVIREKEWTIELFNDREAALGWLLESTPTEDDL